MATEIRHLARTEVREVQEPFAEGQKGSSAMPHKRNPVVSERISGLARVVRGHAQAALENVALWHERDISHSSAERVIFPDSTGLLDFMLADMTSVLEGLVVFPERMRANLDADGGHRVQPVRAAGAGRAGLARDEAYAHRAARGRRRLGPRAPLPRGARGRTPRCTARSAAEELDELFDPRRFLRNLGGVFEKLEKLPVEEGDVSAPAGLHARGKVRDLYEAGDDLLLVATDRISAFDVVLPDADPRQGPRADRSLAVLVRADEGPGAPTT